MIISEVDQLICVDEADNYASSPLYVFPAGMGNAQYYNEEGGVIIDVSPHFTNANKLIFVPQIFSALESRYAAPDSGGIITFRLNNISSSEAIIAQGTVAQFSAGTALINANRTWGTKADGTVLKYSDVFKTETYTIDGNITMPALAVKGDLPYGSRHDIAIFAECPISGMMINCKFDVEIRSMVSDNFKVVIAAVSSLGGNDQVINTASEYIDLTASLLKNGTSTGISSATYRWYKQSDPNTTLATTAKLRVTESMVNGVEEFVCDVTYMGSTFSESITINDIQDQYMINKGRHVYTDSGKMTELESTNIIKSSYYVEYVPSVIDKLTGTTYAGTGTWSFQFIQTGNDGASISTKTGSSDSVTGATVKAHGGVNMKINATNSNI